jgi:hypothetical protein
MQNNYFIAVFSIFLFLSVPLHAEEAISCTFADPDQRVHSHFSELIELKFTNQSPDFQKVVIDSYSLLRKVGEQEPFFKRQGKPEIGEAFWTRDFIYVSGFNFFTEINRRNLQMTVWIESTNSATIYNCKRIDRPKEQRLM